MRKLGDDLKMEDIGFTRLKLRSLVRGYVHEESRAAAIKLWEGRVERGKYGSVGFHCFNHLLKGGDGQVSHWERVNQKKHAGSGKPMRASVMGPCIQSVSLTLTAKKKTHVDCFYRTTELFKKFPADLVFIRDVLLEPFDFSQAPIERVTFHFANVTCHPMYFVTLIPMLDDPIAELEELKKRDRRFYDWTIKWTARFTHPDYHRGIDKFAQALRVKVIALRLIDAKVLKKLNTYLVKNHPGHRTEYHAPNDDDTDD